MTRFRCPGCGADAVVEPSVRGTAVLAPLEAAGLGLPRAAALLDGKRALELLRRARDWMRWYGEGLADLRRAVPSPSPSRAGGGGSPESPGEDTPSPRRPRASRGRSVPRGRGRTPRSPPPPSAGGAPADLPRTREEALELLGLDPGATPEEVAAAYRAASRRCHPDLVARLDEEFRALAHEKFLRLQRARELLAGRGDGAGPG